MAVDMFLNIDKVKGESVDHKHKEEIDVMAFSWGMSQTGTAHMGGGGGAGKANVQDISFTKYLDKSSPVLMQACCKGTHFPKAVLTVRKAGDKPLEYYKITLEDLLVTSISSGGSGGEDRLTETVALNFARFKVEYTPQKPDGSGEAAVAFGFNVATNTVT
jgi:type VI secretion system secreted protein Hcp